MMLLLSPAKSLDMQRRLATPQTTEPQFKAEIAELTDILKDKSVSQIKVLMGLSDKLAELNHRRYQDFAASFNENNASPALAAFNGDVYDGLNAAALSADDLHYAQAHLRMLSGLYGVLRPLDLIQPYRLEMGTRLPNPKGEDLYDFWGGAITRALNEAAEASRAACFVNLASQEYIKAVQTDTLTRPMITPVFREARDGKLKMISFYAKKARGTMARWIIRHRIEQPEALKDFAEDGYRFDNAGDTKGSLHFVRTRQA